MVQFGDAALKKILSDKTSGSIELLRKLNNYFSNERGNITYIKTILPEVRKYFHPFENIQKYLSELERTIHDGGVSDEFFQQYDAVVTSIDKIFSKALPNLKNCKTILTLSNSSTVYELLTRLQNVKKNLKVIACESRPKLEGRIMASRLTKSGIKVQFITEAMMAEYVQKCDAALIGADFILNNGNLANKVGSKTLAVLCKEFKKPFYVAADKSKLSKKNKFVQQDQSKDEIWRSAPKKIVIVNRYFEIIPKTYITKLLTD